MTDDAIQSSKAHLVQEIATLGKEKERLVKRYEEDMERMSAINCQLIRERDALKEQLATTSKGSMTVEAMQGKLKIAVEGLEEVKYKAPWCSCMDASRIAEEALKRIRGEA